VGDVQPIN